MKDLSIVILNYNTEELLKNCLRSLTKIPESELSSEVIVADNGSTDGSVGMIKKEFPKITLVRNGANLGFATGNNRAIPFSSGRFVLFLNSDTLVPPKTLPYMVGFMDRSPKVGISTCLVELPNGEIDIDCHRGFPNPWSSLAYFSGLAKLFPKSAFFNQYHLGSLDLRTIHEIDACVGAFLLVRREVGEKVGWWDEEYFFYGEDLEICFRVKEAGYKVVYNPKVKIIHYKGATSGVRKESAQITKASANTKKMVIRSSIEAMRIFYQKHYLEKYPPLLTWLVFRALDIKYFLRLRGVK